MKSHKVERTKSPLRRIVKRMISNYFFQVSMLISLAPTNVGIIHMTATSREDVFHPLLSKIQ